MTKKEKDPMKRVKAGDQKQNKQTSQQTMPKQNTFPEPSPFLRKF